MKKTIVLLFLLGVVVLAGVASALAVTSADELATSVQAVHQARAQVDAADDQLQAAWAAQTSTAVTTTDTTPTTTTDPSTTTIPSGSGDVVSTDKTWSCPGEVHLNSVTVTINPGASSTDGVLLKNGCTGSIGTITVTQYKGDGIHITNAKDLTIGNVVIRCYAHVDGKHQDGIQVLGGSNVRVYNADVGCYSANNSQVWINDGSGGTGPGGRPTDVVFYGGKFQGLYNGGQYGPGGSYGVSIGDSLRSGFKGSTICPNAHPARQFNVTDSATDPVDVDNSVLTSC